MMPASSSCRHTAFFTCAGEGGEATGAAGLGRAGLAWGRHETRQQAAAAGGLPTTTGSPRALFMTASKYWMWPRQSQPSSSELAQKPMP
jgi:hypothetical protein